MNDEQWLARRFEEDRPRLEAVAFRMLGSSVEAEDAVQEAWFRLIGTQAEEIRNLSGWLTTVVGRVCLDQLRSRKSRREQPIPETGPEPVALPGPASDPESEALLADSVSLALLVVLETLDPAERLAFVLHDMFAVPFDDIAQILDRSPAAARKLASRARKRVQGAPEPLGADLNQKKSVIEAFLNAARGGDFDALVDLLDPDVTARTDGGAVGPIIRGAAQLASGAITFAAMAESGQLVLVGDRIGIIAGNADFPTRVTVFTVEGGQITALEAVTDAELLRDMELTLI